MRLGGALLQKYNGDYNDINALRRCFISFIYLPACVARRKEYTGGVENSDLNLERACLYAPRRLPRVSGKLKTPRALASPTALGD